MFLESIRLYNFRNHRDAQFQFSKRVNCLVGNNGSGKTNLLDAVYFLALTKSSVQKQDLLSISHQEIEMALEGDFIKEDLKENIRLTIISGQKKAVFANRKVYTRITEHIGKYPVVLIAPDDTDLIRDAANVRRKLFDGIIAQFDKAYLKDFQEYNKLLDQRNSLLKQFKEKAYFDQKMLDSYSEWLVKLAKRISSKRQEFLNIIGPMVQKHYLEISGSQESIDIAYQTEVGPDFKEKFKANEFQDRQALRTTMGTHKDDYIFSLNGVLAKKYASQGQKKSYALSIRLAQFDLLEKEKGIKPILLLDDIFDKLDDNRIQKIIEKIDGDIFGQVFITDARPERTRRILENLKANVQYIML